MSPEPSSSGKSVNDVLRDAFEGGEFQSMDEVQALADRVMHEHNARAVNEFDGLSPEQMRILLQPGRSDDTSLLIQHDPVDVSGVEVMDLLSMLVDRIGDKGLKPTATGNLPRQVCRDIARDILGEEGYAHHTRFGGINSEPDYNPLHLTRICAEMAGLVRKHKGKFILSKCARDVLGKNGIAGLYPDMLRAYTEEYNWAYTDRYPDLHFIRDSWRFSLWLLHRHGTEEHPSEFYAEKYRLAFPMLVNELAQQGGAWIGGDPNASLKSAYSLRTLERFGEFFGLIKRRELDPGHPLSDYTVRRGPMMACWEFVNM